MMLPLPGPGASFFDAAAAIEQRRVALGIRRPIQLRSRSARAGITHQGQLCLGCNQRIRPAERIKIDEDINCAIQSRRFRYWHATCHPQAVERAWNAARRGLLQRYSVLPT